MDSIWLLAVHIILTINIIGHLLDCFYCLFFSFVLFRGLFSVNYRIWILFLSSVHTFTTWQIIMALLWKTSIQALTDNCFWSASLISKAYMMIVTCSNNPCSSVEDVRSAECKSLKNLIDDSSNPPFGLEMMRKGLLSGLKRRALIFTLSQLQKLAKCVNNNAALDIIWPHPVRSQIRLVCYYAWTCSSRWQTVQYLS